MYICKDDICSSRCSLPGTSEPLEQKAFLSLLCLAHLYVLINFTGWTFNVMESFMQPMGLAAIKDPLCFYFWIVVQLKIDLPIEAWNNLELPCVFYTKQILYVYGPILYTFLVTLSLNPNPDWIWTTHIRHWLWATCVPQSHDSSDRALDFLGKHLKLWSIISCPPARTLPGRWWVWYRQSWHEAMRNTQKPHKNMWFLLLLTEKRL